MTDPTEPPVTVHEGSKHVTERKAPAATLRIAKEKPDPGRGAISKDAKDDGAFKTPGLRSVAISGPYFHDGSMNRLEDAVRYMASGGMPNPNRSPLLENVTLSDAEVRQVVAFLVALTSEEPAVKPALP